MMIVIKSHLACIILVSSFSVAPAILLGVVSGVPTQNTLPPSAAILDEPAILLGVVSGLPTQNTLPPSAAILDEPAILLGGGQRSPHPKHAPTISRHLG